MKKRAGVIFFDGIKKAIFSMSNWPVLVPHFAQRI
jgi:hypothetical protein